MALGATLYCLGEFLSARGHDEQGIALYDLQQHRALAFLYGGTDPGMACLTQNSWTLWMLGYPDQALQRNQDALTLAQELSHPHSLAFALIHLGHSADHLGDPWQPILQDAVHASLKSLRRHGATAARALQLNLDDTRLDIGSAMLHNGSR